MTLTQEAIDELKAIYRRKYGEELSNDGAWEMGNRLMRVFAVLAREPDRLPIRKAPEDSDAHVIEPAAPSQAKAVRAPIESSKAGNSNTTTDPRLRLTYGV